MVPMLMRSDPFRELDRLSQQMLAGMNGTVAEQARPRRISVTSGTQDGSDRHEIPSRSAERQAINA